MLTAGCVNQAKRIIEKHDEILYGPTPEKLVKDTHQAIKALLRSPECAAFQSKADKSGQQGGDPGGTYTLTSKPNILGADTGYIIYAAETQ